MTAKLCEEIPENFLRAADRQQLFTEAENRALGNFERTEQSGAGGVESCQNNLYFGFFFDGTKNNYVQAEEGKNHSNVARLYDCFPGQSVPGVLPDSTNWTADVSGFQHFFRTYIPGVASPFREVKDSGEKLQKTTGAAGGAGGQARIGWALVQAINHIHRYFLKVPLIDANEFHRVIRCINLSSLQRQNMTFSDSYFRDDTNSNRDSCNQFTAILKRLHSSVKQHWHEPGQLPCKKAPGVVNQIRVSVFGFSRGATQARVFANWLVALCELDAQICGKSGLTLGGFPVEFDFIGLFDTVASVGLANSYGNTFWGQWLDGHGAWADAESNLRIPSGVPCLHLVAAHEIRRSFPLDSVSINGVFSDSCQEIVIPGVHSDIGSGYCPKEQGRGVDDDGADMLARVPLIMMYKAARLSGVPLKLELASDVAKKRFAISKNVIDDLNSYLSCCEVKRGTLTEIMREQAKLRMLYHRARRVSGVAPVTRTESFLRATNFDKNDLESSYTELEAELEVFESELNTGKIVQDRLIAQKPGFDNEKANEWREISRWWRDAQPPGPAVLKMFDDYVHDSRAWFKLSITEKDNEAEVAQQLMAWARIAEEAEKYAKSTGRTVNYARIDSNPKKAAQKAEIAKQYAKDKQFPRMENGGREAWEIAGYLRYRKVYSGADSMLISENRTKEKERVYVKAGDGGKQEITAA